jgi:hypothetical protein
MYFGPTGARFKAYDYARRTRRDEDRRKRRVRQPRPCVDGRHHGLGATRHDCTFRMAATEWRRMLATGHRRD